jgi:hypothetical protein
MNGRRKRLQRWKIRIVILERITVKYVVSGEIEVGTIESHCAHLVSEGREDGLDGFLERLEAGRSDSVSDIYDNN